MSRCALVVAAVLAAGCTKKNPDFCESNADCPDGICDINGEHGPANTCTDAVPDAGAFDAPSDSPDAPPDDVDAGGGECASSAECTNTGAPICDDSSGTCRACSSGDECIARDPSAPGCTGDGRCVECASHGDCSSDACDITMETCIAEADVVYVKPGGSTSAGCGAKSDPCATFALAVAETTPSRDVIKAEPAVYNEFAAVDVNGIGITVIADGAILDPAGVAHGFSARNAASLEIRGLTIQGAAASAAVVCEEGDDVTLVLRDVTIRNNQYGIWTNFTCGSGFSLSVEDSTIVSNQFGVLADRAGQNATFHRTRVENNTSDGMLLSGTNRLEECSVLGNGGAGVNLTAVDATILRTEISDNIGGGVGMEDGDIHLENSVLLNNGGFGGIRLNDSNPSGESIVAFSTIASSTGTGPQMQCQMDGSISAPNNIVYDNLGSPNVAGTCNFTFSNVEGGTTGMGNIDLPPMFVGVGDFHIQSGSPSRDTADPDATVSVDFEGDVRPVGMADMGADEFVP